MNIRILLPLVFTMLVGCGVTDKDRSNMNEKMALETARAKIWTTAVPDCKKLAADSTAFNTQNKEALTRLGTWWDALSPTSRKELLDAHAVEDSATIRAMMLATKPCPEEVKASIKGN
jgi:hypothetical protein